MSCTVHWSTMWELALLKYSIIIINNFLIYQTPCDHQASDIEVLKNKTISAATTFIMMGQSTGTSQTSIDPD